MKNPFTQQTVPTEFYDLSGKMVESVDIDPTQPGYFSHRIFTGRLSEPSTEYDPQKDTVETVKGTNYVKITDTSTAALKEIAFLDRMGLIVTGPDGGHYMSPLAAVFYGSDGLFAVDLSAKLSSLPTAEDRMEFFRPVFGLFANYILPGRIMRARLVRGALPDTVYEGQKLTEEVHEMQAVLNHIVSLL